MTRILITGVRGKTGAPLADRLVARPGVDLRGGSSDPTAVTIAGVRPVAFSWDRPADWPAATDGLDALYLVRPDRPDAPELIADLLAGTPAPVRVVLLSEKAAETLTPDGWASRAEDAVRRSGRPWTLLRPGWFMQVFTDPRFYRDQVRAGRLPFSTGGARVAWIDARDIAAVAEQALLDAAHAGQTYELSGPEALTLPETAQLLSKALGRPVGHVEQGIEDEVAGLTGFERQLTETTFRRLHAGIFAEVTGTVQQVTGRPARTLAAFLTDR